jgi:tRNA dimethylallyltransferase
VGCTATGKSALAMGLARRLGDAVELVSMDSMQVYRGMDIGTAKPTRAERAEVPHHLIDVVDPSAEWALSEHLAAARQAVTAIEARGRRAVMVGGTGLYVSALVDGLTPPGRWPEVRIELDSELDTPGLHRRLADLDPLGASRMEPTNRRRVLRALEVTLGSGRPFSSYGPGMTGFPPTPWQLIGLAMSPVEVGERIARRLRAMAAAGFLDEVRCLAQADGGWSRTAAQALGYRQMLSHLQGHISFAEAIDAAIAATRSFAKRQRAWWRRDPRIQWYEAGQNAVDLVAPVLGDWAPT